jgi:hypothetical protein
LYFERTPARPDRLLVFERSAMRAAAVFGAPYYWVSREEACRLGAIFFRNPIPRARSKVLENERNEYWDPREETIGLRKKSISVFEISGYWDPREVPIGNREKYLSVFGRSRYGDLGEFLSGAGRRTIGFGEKQYRVRREEVSGTGRNFRP